MSRVISRILEDGYGSESGASRVDWAGPSDGDR